MVKKNVVLLDMEKTDGNGKRTIFSIAYFTANIEMWTKKKNLLAAAALLSEGQEKSNLIESAKNIDAGGRIVFNDKCALSKREGRATSENTEKEVKGFDKFSRAPKHRINRTRNLNFLPSIVLRKLHYDNIVEYRGQPVLY